MVAREKKIVEREKKPKKEEKGVWNQLPYVFAICTA